MSARDTQFAGFAKLVVEDLRLHGGFPMRPVNRSEVRPLIERIIARRAYDLAYHVMSETTVGMAAENEGGELSRQENIDAIPDLTHWPEEVQHGSS